MKILLQKSDLVWIHNSIQHDHHILSFFKHARIIYICHYLGFLERLEMCSIPISSLSVEDIPSEKPRKHGTKLCSR